MSEAEIVKKIDAELSLGRSIVLFTIIHKEGSGPRNLGAKMLVSSDGKHVGTIGGGSMERLLVRKALETLANGKPETLHFALGVPARKDMIPVDSKCGGEMKIFMDVIKPDPRLIIMGSGLIAQAVSKYGRDCGFEVIIIDDAKTAISDNFPDVKIINSKFPKSLDKLDIRPSDFVAILHGETDFELAGLRYAVKAKPLYIGLLGSRNKLAEHKKQLKKEGLDTNIVDFIKGPIGIEINAETPMEIGISIIAELINKKRS